MTIYHRILSIVVLGCGLLGSSLVMAQPNQPPVDAGALQQGLERQLPMPSPLQLPQPAPEPVKPRDPKAQEVRVDVKRFVLEGIKTIPEEKVQAILKPYLNKSLTFDELQKVCDVIVDFYRQNGLLVQATLPPQRIADGVVRIAITEAKLSDVIVDTTKGTTRFSKDSVRAYITDANPIGSPLNTQAIERASLILNETPGVIVESKLEPGQNPGDTALRMDLADGPLIQGKAEANNYGSRSTGQNQGIVAFNLNNPTGIGDQASVNGIYSEGSQYIQGAYSLPVTHTGLRLGASGTYLNYKNVSNYGYPNGGYGDAWTAGVNLAYPLIRRQGTNVNTTLGYDIKSYMNKSFLTNAVISAYDIKNITFGISGNHYDGFGGGAISAGSLGFVIGNLAISPTSGQGYGSNTPTSFTKITFSANRNQQLGSATGTTLYVGISGQVASVNLNSAEQFYLGGPYGVRAYPVAQGGGSQGGLGTIELRQQLPYNVLGSVFFDAGVVQQYKNTPAGNWQGATNANNTYWLKGAGFGAKWNYEGWNLGAMVAWQVGQNPLYTYTGQKVAVDGTTTNPRGWVTASYQF
ncbi:ShlB/FhaC/HecB family hemolysin secretion/activation protein [Polynucleobacter sp. HIN5]|uniref:ShlB/FhaC/HecB family hemolysin secretion/activation protein n=1 Tax=Polynucleobacter sp. HIN5 TaxID=3047864 RepID=UPI0025742B93|nr:ShlB/FhaC/HecB family hemolysin secretion/activation protein [Polynucleobacter sp. HIN5]BEI34027.1 ShlB/FhaC/HecB family hemolysin secretion/activation protein [Polynucleobacter sp. HIN5]